MNERLALIGGIGIGAGLMYVLDPEKGRRRRARMRDKVAHAINKTEDALDTTSRDMRNRARGIAAEARSLLKRDEVSDEVLVDRVRSKMGRVVSHPHSIHVTVNHGRVTLSGTILEREVNDLLKCVSSMRAVTAIENHLGVHERGGDVPGLQGGIARRGEPFELMQVNWSPTARLLVGATGSALMFYGANRRDAIGITLSAFGLGLVVRGLTNAELKHIVGAGGRRAIDIQKDMYIAAPVERVFDFWANCENFPHFMRNVREVRKTDEGRYHWTVVGPAGVSVEWDAEVTKLVPNQILAWKSVPGSVIEHAGIIHFDLNAEGGTRISLKMSYNPPAGMVGHAVATLLGANPKKEMDEDLVRMKTMIETGKAPRDAALKQATAREASARSQ